MKGLADSILVLSGALALGIAQLAQAVAFSRGWDDTPVSMRVIGGLILVAGLILTATALIRDRDAERFTILSGAILVLAGVVVFAFAKIALAIDYPAGRTEKPFAMLAIGTSLTLAGLAIAFWHAISRR